MTHSPHSRSRLGVRTAGAVAALCATAFLASCGGSDDGTPPVAAPVASNTPPASASANTLGFIAYLKTVVPMKPETTDPLDVTAFVAPTDDTGDPDPGV